MKIRKKWQSADGLLHRLPAYQKGEASRDRKRTNAGYILWLDLRTRKLIQQFRL